MDPQDLIRHLPTYTVGDYRAVSDELNGWLVDIDPTENQGMHMVRPNGDGALATLCGNIIDTGRTPLDTDDTCADCLSQVSGVDWPEMLNIYEALAEYVHMGQCLLCPAVTHLLNQDTILEHGDCAGRGYRPRVGTTADGVRRMALGKMTVLTGMITAGDQVAPPGSARLAHATSQRASEIEREMWNEAYRRGDLFLAAIHALRPPYETDALSAAAHPVAVRSFIRDVTRTLIRQNDKAEYSADSVLSILFTI